MPREVSTPTLTPGTGTFYEPQTVTIHCSTADAAIYYTLDGSEPQETSNAYTGPITIDGAITIKAKAFLKGWRDSVTTSETYTFVVADPAIIPMGGTFLDGVPAVFITCITPGATIHFTTDETEPTIFSPVFTVAFVVEISTQVKAKAFRNGYLDSQTSAELFLIKLAPPTFYPYAGTFTWDVTVSIHSPLADFIMYTLNNREPALRNSFPEFLQPSSHTYTDPFSITETTTIKAKAYKNGCENSDTAIAVYTLKTPTPQMITVGGRYENGVGVTMNVDHHSYTYYTIDGSTPTRSSLLYHAADTHGPFGYSFGEETPEQLWFDVSTTLKAKSFKLNCEDSDVATAVYTIKAASPTFGPCSSAFDSFTYVTLYCKTPGATIRYTTDGSEPVNNSTPYTQGFFVNQTTTIKAKAFKAGIEPSSTASKLFTQTTSTKVSKPIILPVPQGLYMKGSVIGVTIYCGTYNATIRYTLNGSTPTISSPAYTSKISIVTPKTVKAKAFKQGLAESMTSTAAYKSL